MTLPSPPWPKWLPKVNSPKYYFGWDVPAVLMSGRKQITRDICKILNHVGISFAVLGTEESCTGDPAKRAGNEFLFQMQAMSNIQVLDAYQIKKIVTGCPHCFNIIKK